MTRHGDREFEYFDGFQDRAKPLHQSIVDRFVIAGESIRVLQHNSLAVSEQRVVAVRMYRVVDVFPDRIFRARRKSPLQSNGASIDIRDEESDEFSLSYRQLAAFVHGGIERSDSALEDR